ncbi:MAG: hypothetical protein Q9187_007174 [Circinaria calcarea]
MRSFRVFQQTTRLFTQHASRATRQKFSSALRRPLTSPQFPFIDLCFRTSRHPSVKRLLHRRFASSQPPFNPTPNLNSPEPALSLSQRLRKLSREYGWSALGVYLLLSAIDFPFSFLAVRLLGTDRIGRWEHIIVEWLKRASPIQIPTRKAAPAVEVVGTGTTVEAYGVVDPKNDVVAVPGYDHGVKEAEQRNRSENASIWTQLALAYAIHKSFIFIRVPLTAAITPKVVKVLRGWGWNIGKIPQKNKAAIVAKGKGMLRKKD